MGHFSYEGGCGGSEREHMRIGVFKRKAGLGYSHMASTYYQYNVI